MSIKKIVVAAAAATVAAGMAATPAGAQSADYSGSSSVALPDVPATSNEVHKSLFKLCLGNPGDPYYYCDETRVDVTVEQAGFKSGTLTMTWIASRNGARPDVQQSSGFPLRCGGAPGAEILLTTFSSVTKVGATLTLQGSEGTEDKTMSVPTQQVDGAGRTIPAYACVTVVDG